MSARPRSRNAVVRARRFFETERMVGAPLKKSARFLDRVIDPSLAACGSAGRCRSPPSGPSCCPQHQSRGLWRNGHPAAAAPTLRLRGAPRLRGPAGVPRARPSLSRRRARSALAESRGPRQQGGASGGVVWKWGSAPRSRPLTRACCRPGPNRFGRREIYSTQASRRPQQGLAAEAHGVRRTQPSSSQ